MGYYSFILMASSTGFHSACNLVATIATAAAVVCAATTAESYLLYLVVVMFKLFV